MVFHISRHEISEKTEPVEMRPVVNRAFSIQYGSSQKCRAQRKNRSCTEHVRN